MGSTERGIQIQKKRLQGNISSVSTLTKEDNLKARLQQMRDQQAAQQSLRNKERGNLNITQLEKAKHDSSIDQISKENLGNTSLLLPELK